jgi:thiol-disulfide isomerase/thioredoxin
LTLLHTCLLALSCALSTTSLQEQSEFDTLYKSVAEKHKAVSGDMTMKLREWAPFVIKTLNDNDFSKYSSEQLLKLAALNLFDDLPMTDEDQKRKAFVVMVEDRPTRDHWDAALKLRMTMQSPKILRRDTLRELYDMLMSDLAMKEFMEGPQRDTFLSLFIYWIPAETASEKPDRLKKLAHMLPDVWPLDWAGLAPSLVSTVFTESRVGADMHARIRKRGFDVMDRYLAEHPTGRTADFLKTSKSRLTSAGYLNTLIGALPKQLTFQWSSDPKIKRLSDLKGRVVVLDFWATWCKPCLQSVPDIRQLQKDFEGYPVTILGITSLQGAVFGIEKDKIPTEGDPNKEYKLTMKVAEKHGVTWPTVFTKEDVFNPEFGNGSIPYGAILDPEGKVRFTKLHPGNDGKKMREHIIELLKEFKLKHP